MTSVTESTTEVAASLQRLAALPGWLLAALQPDQVSAALVRDIPELASGALKLRSCKVKRLLLKDDSGRWTGAYNVAVEDPQTGQKRTIVLDGTLTTDYDDGPVGMKGSQYHAAGQSFMDRGGWWHNHLNKTDKPVKYLILHLGYPGEPNPVRKAEPE